MCDTRYISLEEAILLHAIVTGVLGQEGSSLKAGGDVLVGSALGKAWSLGRFGDADIITQAAEMTACVGLAHGFIDGNKRAAHVVCTTFLARNGWHVVGDTMALAGLIEKVMATIDKEERAQVVGQIAAWLRLNTWEIRD